MAQVTLNYLIHWIRLEEDVIQLQLEKRHHNPQDYFTVVFQVILVAQLALVVIHISPVIVLNYVLQRSYNYVQII